MAKPKVPRPPAAVDEGLPSLLLNCFSKYCAFDLSVGQLQREVTAPIIELLIALDGLMDSGRVREVAPGRYRLASAAQERPPELRDRRKIEVRPEGTFIDGNLAPPDEVVLPYGDDQRGELFSAWTKAFAVRTIRQRGIVAGTLDRGLRHYLDVRFAREHGIREDRFIGSNLIGDADVIPVERVAQAHVDRRDSQIEDVRKWASMNPDREAYLPAPMTLEEAKAIVEKAAMSDVLREATQLAHAKASYLRRPGLDEIWSFARHAEGNLPVPHLTEAERNRAHRLWQVARIAIGWALRVEAGGSSETWETRGGRPVTADGHKKNPRFRTPVTVGRSLDEFIDQVDRLGFLESAESMERDEAIAELKPTLARMLRKAKQLDHDWKEQLPDDSSSRREKAITGALFDTVAWIAIGHGTALGDADRKRLVAGFPKISSTRWVTELTSRITGAPKDIVKQTAGNRLKRGPTPKPHDPPPVLRDGKGEVVGLAVGPNPLEKLELDLHHRTADAALRKRAEVKLGKRAAAKRAAEAKLRRAKGRPRRTTF